MNNASIDYKSYMNFVRRFSLNNNELYSMEFPGGIDVTNLVGIGESAKQNKLLYSNEGLYMRWIYQKRSGEHERKNGGIFIEREKYGIKRPENNFRTIGKINVVKGYAVELICFDFLSLYKALFKEDHKDMPLKSFIL